MLHKHSHRNEHGVRSGQSTLRNVALTGLGLNLLLFAIKLAAGVIGYSYALVADSFHSLSDCSSDLAVLIGLRMWTKPPDAAHPHGHRRIETVVSILIGVILLAAGVRLAAGGIGRIVEGVGRRPRLIALAVALISVFSKEMLYRWGAAIGKKHASKATVANALHHRSDALSSLPVPFAVITVYFFPQWVIADSVVAVIVALLITYTAVMIILPAVKELIDTSASDAECASIERLALSVKGVRGVHGLRTRYMGSRIAVDLHITVDGDMDVRTGHDLSEEVKDRITSEGPNVVDVVVHIEPSGAEGQSPQPGEAGD